MRSFLFFFVFLLLLFPLASAIGVTPPSRTIQFEDNYTGAFSFTFINNNENPDIFVSLSLSSALDKYAVLSEQNFSFEGKKYHTVTVQLNLPEYEDLGVYGTQIIRVRASERAKASGSFSVGTAVGAWIKVKIPVPGTLGEIKAVSIANALEGKDTELTLSIDNLGTDAISDSYARVEISDFSGNRIDTLSFNNINIPTEENIILNSDVFTNSYDSGKYFIDASYYFSDDFAPSTKSSYFFVGSTDIFVSNYSKILEAEKINKVAISAQSLWGSPLEDVSFSLNYNGVSVPLPDLTFKPFEEISFDAFIEAPAITDRKKDSIPLDATLDVSFYSNDNLIVKSIPLKFEVIRSKSGLNMSSTTLLIIGGIILLILLILVNFIIISKISKNNSKSKKK